MLQNQKLRKCENNLSLEINAGHDIVYSSIRDIFLKKNFVWMIYINTCAYFLKFYIQKLKTRIYTYIPYL